LGKNIYITDCSFKDSSELSTVLIVHLVFLRLSI
jgi:hypothetical protein